MNCRCSPRIEIDTLLAKKIQKVCLYVFYYGYLTRVTQQNSGKNRLTWYSHYKELQGGMHGIRCAHYRE